jgi:hypothetical protein
MLPLLLSFIMAVLVQVYVSFIATAASSTARMIASGFLVMASAAFALTSVLLIWSGRCPRCRARFFLVPFFQSFAHFGYFDPFATRCHHCGFPGPDASVRNPI